MMGQYLTRVEGKLIERAFDDRGWPKLLLDIGGGDGRLVKQMPARGVCPIVLEADPIPLQELKVSTWHYPLILGEGNLLPIKSNSVDAVMTVQVTPCTDAEHNVHYFSEVYRVLKERGIFLVVTDNKRSILGAMNQVAELPGHIKKPYRFYSESYAITKGKLVNAGFKIGWVKGFRWIPFSRTSNSRLIPVFSAIERFLGLEKLVKYSPWLFWVAVK